jgi:uncharacterized protein (DUF2249 family)
MVDLRTVQPRARLAVVVYTGQLLRPGEAMEVTDEYDPVDVFIDFARKPDAFTWEYLERGPKVWRARITRTVAPKVPVPAAATADASAC